MPCACVQAIEFDNESTKTLACQSNSHAAADSFIDKHLLLPQEEALACTTGLDGTASKQLSGFSLV